ncbi:efflux RND transporter periplasmic adaptor subunit [Thiomicrorhabdus sp. Milos-T2]|uniref:efflux RND transporter periplasmic adaptor subunit n=1 Tax=Thiomicrorhabdus sp. Milos-T2 TaxID=90814 RepID=UPI0004945202|nr:efflux RND transporter periplasmic adaptor subunit [Thiomicrorhabdus sp. Milos-T2]
MNKWLGSQLVILMALTNTCFADAAVPEIQVVATVKTTPVVQKVIQQNVIAYGTILPDADQINTLSMPHAGMVEKVWVRPGQKVKKGDLLFSLNVSPGEKMTYLQAQASVEFAKKDLKRQEKLLLQHLATKSQVNSAKKTLQDAQIHLDSLKKQGLGKNLQHFISPQDGIVTQVNVQAGQRVQADTSALQIASDQQFVVRLGVESEDLRRLAVGQTVKIQSVFDLDKPFFSKISQIHAMLNPTTHLVDIIVPIPPEQTAHYVLGSRLKGEILLESHSSLIVPRSTILTDSKGSYVFSVKNGEAQKISVNIGQSTHQWIEVTQGLKPGDKVAFQGNYELETGMKVQEEAK